MAKVKYEVKSWFVNEFGKETPAWSVQTFDEGAAFDALDDWHKGCANFAKRRFAKKRADICYCTVVKFDDWGSVLLARERFDVARHTFTTEFSAF